MTFLREDSLRGKIAFLKKVFLFQDLTHKALLLLASRMMEKNYAEGELVFREGDAGRACFIIAEGKVEIFRENGDPTSPDILVDLGPGEFFGEMVLLDELPRSASVRVVEPARLYILYKTHFDALMAESPRVASHILHSLARLLSARLRRENDTPAPKNISNNLEVS